MDYPNYFLILHSLLLSIYSWPNTQQLCKSHITWFFCHEPSNNFLRLEARLHRPWGCCYCPTSSSNLFLYSACCGHKGLVQLWIHLALPHLHEVLPPSRMLFCQIRGSFSTRIHILGQLSHISRHLWPSCSNFQDDTSILCVFWYFTCYFTLKLFYKLLWSMFYDIHSIFKT